MPRILSALLPALVAVTVARAAEPAPLRTPAEDAWLPVYQLANLAREQARVDPAALELWAGGPYRRPLHGYLMDDPLRLPAVGQVQGAAFVAGAGSVAGTLGTIGWAADLGVRRGLTVPVVDVLRGRLDQADPLRGALVSLSEAAGGGVDATPTGDLPRELQEAVGVVLLAAEGTLRWRERAFADAPATGLGAHIVDLGRFAALDHPDDQPGAEAMRHQDRLDRLVETLEVQALTAAAMDVCLAVDFLRQHLTGVNLDLVATRRYATALGDVVIAGPEADVHDDPSPFLVVDVGGDDVYAVGAAAAAEDRPVSIVIDLDGNDRYGGQRAVTCGAAVGGVAVQADERGDDTYTGTDITQGCGIGGVGVLWDGAGDDAYEGRLHAQGAAAFGLGALTDVAGRDTYRCLSRGQGFAYAMAGGALVDVAGDDTYTAQDDAIVLPSAQTAEHNTSLAQGFGFGRRGDTTDGRSLAGGVGWLVDGAGNDHYICGVFGQGGGYWYGVGLLSELDGNDTYDGVWYVQGAAAHFAVGGLVDTGGDDRYTATMNMAQGAGHDLSLGFLADLAGDDGYAAPNLALGAGNANGVGYLWEAAGNDVYDATDGPNLGRAVLPGTPAQLATSLRSLTRTLGLFLDSGGRDRYPRGRRDGEVWFDRPEGSLLLGVGVDR